MTIHLFTPRSPIILASWSEVLIRHGAWLWLIKMGRHETRSDYYLLEPALGRQDLRVSHSSGGNYQRPAVAEGLRTAGDRLPRLDLEAGLLGALPGLQEQDGATPGCWGQKGCGPWVG